MAAFVAVHTDPPAGNTLENERAELVRVDAELLVPGAAGPLVSLLAQADAVLNTVLPLTAGDIASMARCRVIVRTGVGVDNMDVAAATAAGIVVACVPDASVEEVSNHALGLLLAVSRKLVRLDRALRAGRWDRTLLPPMGTIHGQTLGIVGFGRIGQALCRKALALGLRVLASDPLVPASAVSAAGASPLSLEELLRTSDFVSLHAPLVSGTAYLIGERELALMLPSAFLINTARGGLVDQVALTRALQSGRLTGAGLDVFEQEPLPASDPLLALDNVILTPHSAAFSDASVREIRRRSGEAAAAVLAGRWPQGLVNAGVKPRFPLAGSVP
ncbi:MAG: C-terminal binding protein [Chloroflexi bacterium]|nr:C-terminal binding protein [Chloroflexota bacterium]